MPNITFWHSKSYLTFEFGPNISSFLPLNCQMIAYLSSPLLWELGTNFPQSQHLVRDCQFGVSPVNCSDSDSDSDPDIRIHILTYEFRLNIAFWHSKTYFDIRTLAKYRILTFEILFWHSNSGLITYFDIRDPVSTFEFRRNIAFWHSKCYFDIRTGPNITFWHSKYNFYIRTRAEYRILTFEILFLH